MKRSVIVTMPDIGDSRFKSWAKRVDKVDCHKNNGYAFEGPWLQPGRKTELPIGAIVLYYHEHGSRAKHLPTVDVHRVASDGLGEPVLVAKDTRDWALELRDKVAELLDRWRAWKTDSKPPKRVPSAVEIHAKRAGVTPPKAEQEKREPLSKRTDDWMRDWLGHQAYHHAHSEWYEAMALKFALGRSLDELDMRLAKLEG